MKKVLFVATVVRTHIAVFHLPYIKMFKDKGYTTVVAAKNDYEEGLPNIPNCDEYVDIPFTRSPFSPKNIKAYKKLKELIDKNDFDIVQCNTPVGGVLGRLAARKARKHKMTKVIYIAHGFHFFKGGSKLAWLLFYPVEKALSRITDILITINKEDYKTASKRFKAKKTMYIHGIGVDLDKCERSNPDRNTVRSKIGLKDDDVMLVSVGEFTKNKNHKTMIKTVSCLNDPKIHYVLLGSGQTKRELKSMVKELGLKQNVHFLGYRDDVYEILKSSDIFCFPSRREGLPVALMEAMASGLPAVVSRVRGNTDLILENKGGLLYDPDDVTGFADGIRKLVGDKKMREEMGNYNRERVKKYDLNVIKEQLAQVYFSEEINE